MRQRMKPKINGQGHQIAAAWFGKKSIPLTNKSKTNRRKPRQVTAGINEHTNTRKPAGKTSGRQLAGNEISHGASV